ncbi:MAG TPA: PD-(D/E)XK nuclease family protein [Methanomassiliicoccales archaeon]|nr:PD-(D/E)XK nuclease family protein [Methanomassiliicoccales archaeon]HPR97834.1 PD-(D/E)XK nuclease family protein [Methanomassiliicoccales archaeon]
MDRTEVISASDLERYGYCPLSWWLGRKSQSSTPEQERGDAAHRDKADEYRRIRNIEQKAWDWERMVFLFSLVATVLAVTGISLMRAAGSVNIGWILPLLSIIWFLAVIAMLYLSALRGRAIIQVRRLQIVAMVGLVLMVVAMNIGNLIQADPMVSMILEALALVWLIAASLALYLSLSASQKVGERMNAEGLEGEIKYVGTDDSQLYLSERYGLSGRPDFVLEIDGQLIPGDLKTGRTPKGPLFSHILQVATYCLLIAESSGKRPPYGLLLYGSEEHEIEFDAELEKILLEKVDEMRKLMRSGEVHRNHNRPGKCASCSRRESCPEKLV